ncbi:MAG: glycosyl hydrolase, partial [Candidatus Aminicenantes bacterium]|nr:glycosyl hydrolase [Candidatus Aminicenantes bacterium]
GAGLLKYRFQWTAPILVSKFDSDVLYHAAQVIFKTKNEGQSWQIISPDLTRNDKTKQKSSGGPITHDNTSVEYYCTIFALAQSYHNPNTLWVGTDDGVVSITKNGGKNWERITPRDLPEWSLISSIEPSTYDQATAYIAVDRHELDDFKPYIYKTDNYGKSWKKITNGLPNNTFVRVVREDQKRKGLLYAGTETGVFVSFDDGSNWQSLQLNLPVVPIHDLVFKRDDLVVATHGRSFWILDDLTPLHQITDAVAKSEMFLFEPRDAYRMRGRGFPRPNVGENPPSGSVIYYYFKEKPEEAVTLEFLDAEGNSIRIFKSRKKEEPEPERIPPSRFQRGGPQNVPVEAGMNRFVWNMRYPDAERIPGAILWGGMLNGPVAVPGVYQVKLTVGEKMMMESWQWKKDLRLLTTQEEYQEQFDFLLKIRDKITEVNQAINRLRDVKKQIDILSRKVKEHEKGKEVIEAAKMLKQKLSSAEDVLIQSKSKSRQDPLNYPIKLDNKIAALAGIVSSADARPTDQSYEVFKALSAKADEQLTKLKDVLKKDLPDFNKLVKKAEIPAIIIK